MSVFVNKAGVLCCAIRRCVARPSCGWVVLRRRGKCRLDLAATAACASALLVREFCVNPRRPVIYLSFSTWIATAECLKFKVGVFAPATTDGGAPFFRSRMGSTIGERRALVRLLTGIVACLYMVSGTLITHWETGWDISSCCRSGTWILLHGVIMVRLRHACTFFSCSVSLDCCLH